MAYSIVTGTTFSPQLDVNVTVKLPEDLLALRVKVSVLPSSDICDPGDTWRSDALLDVAVIVRLSRLLERT